MSDYFNYRDVAFLQQNFSADNLKTLSAVSDFWSRSFFSSLYNIELSEPLEKKSSHPLQRVQSYKKKGGGGRLGKGKGS